MSLLSADLRQVAALAIILWAIAVWPGEASASDGAAAAADQPRIGAFSKRPLPRFASLKTTPVNMRRGPGFAYAVDWELTRVGLPVRIISEFGHWRRVELHTGDKGWIHRALLSRRRTAMFVTDADGLRAQPDIGAGYTARVGVLTPVTLSSCAPDWCLSEIAGVAGWAPRRDLWGVAPGETF